MNNNQRTKRLFRYTCSPRAGFTLIELLIYVTLVAGVLVAATSFAWNIIDSRSKSQAVQEVEQNGRFVMERIIQAAHGATKIASPAPGTSDFRLLLNTKDKNRDPLLYAVVDGTLVTQEGGGKLVTLTSNAVRITAAKFENLTTADGKSGNVRVTFSLDYANAGNQPARQYTDTFTTTIELRDK